MHGTAIFYFLTLRTYPGPNLLQKCHFFSLQFFTDPMYVVMQNTVFLTQGLMFMFVISNSISAMMYSLDFVTIVATCVKEIRVTQKLCIVLLQGYPTFTASNSYPNYFSQNLIHAGSLGLSIRYHRVGRLYKNKKH